MHVSATHLPDESLAVTVHGTAETFPIGAEECAELRQAMSELQSGKFIRHK